ncbi:hypothetical protein BC826DRAFT_918578, partial [Russula brevipes]
SNYDPRRVCVNPFPFLERINLGKHRRTLGVYLAGGLASPPFPQTATIHPLTYAPFLLTSSPLGLWTFFDAAILSAHAHPPYDEPDCPVPNCPCTSRRLIRSLPGICSLLGILVINLIDKDRIRGEEGFGDPRAVWRAHFFLFVGLALMPVAGGLAGSTVRSFSFPTNTLRSNDTDHSDLAMTRTTLHG